ncbi:MAG: hypothetical protein WCK39_03190 [Methanomassiliicoccales archaeon]
MPPLEVDPALLQGGNLPLTQADLPGEEDNDPLPGVVWIALGKKQIELMICWGIIL